MKVSIFQRTTKTADLSHTTPMKEQHTDPMQDASPFKFTMFPDFSREAFTIRGNAHILTSGHCVAEVESVTSVAAGRWITPDDQLREHIEAACTNHMKEHTFSAYSVSSTNVIIR